MVVGVDTYFIFLLAVVIITAAYLDIRSGKIPNLLTYPTMLVAVIYHSIASGWDGLFFSSTGLMLGIGLLVIPYMMGGMGAGDVKLLGAAGSILGPKGVFMSCLLSAVAGGIYAAFLLVLYRRQLRPFIERWLTTLKALILSGRLIYLRPDKKAKAPKLRYGVAIAAGTICYLAAGLSGYKLLF
jgi:prepilin peptidase CpaA